MGYPNVIWLPVFALLSAPLTAPAVAPFIGPFVASVSAAQKAVPTDAQLQSDVSRKIAGLKLGSAAKVTVSVHDRAVTLDGIVPTLWSKQQVIDLARKTDGVQQVESTLQIANAENDTQLAAAVSHDLREYPLLSVYDYVDGVVRNSVVTLTGAVTEPIKSSQITERMQKIRGVHEVDNKIAVLPVSPLDDRIRESIANQIYSNPLFSNYSLSSPPIHVIVDNGHVTLVGIVSSDIERRKAESIAHLVSGVFTVDDKIRLTSELPR